MPRYFFHLLDGVEVVLDPDGAEMPAGAIESAALREARDCMSADVKAGRLDLRYSIEVHDDAGELVHSLAFSDALEIVRAP